MNHYDTPRSGSAAGVLRTAGLSRRRLLRTSALGVAGLAGAALVGCGSSDEDETPASRSAATAADTTASTTATTAATTTTLPDEFVIANEAEPDDLYPWFGGFGQALVTRQVYQTMIEPRLSLAADGSPQWEMVGVLAESWERTGDASWLLHLRPGVTFHNGEPWNADAAVASFDLISNADVMTELKKSNLLAAVPGMTKVDDMTVEVVTAKPGPEQLTLYLRLGYVGLPAGAIAGDRWRSLTEVPIGTGPYRIASWSRGGDLVLERFEGYWGTAQTMARVRYITRPEASVRALTVKTGEAHFAFNVGAENAAHLEHRVVGGGFQTTCLRLNNTKPPFDDIRVRRAVNYAIDRDAIVSSIFHGAARPAAFFAFQPATVEPFPYDPERAAGLIREAGVEGAEVELTWGELRIPEEPQLAEVYKGYLDAVGLNMKLNRLERAAYNEASGAEFPEQPAMLIETTSSGNYMDVEGALADKYGCEGSGTFCEPAIEARWQGLGVLDLEERNALIQSLAAELQTQHAPRAWVAAVQQVHGHAAFVDASALPVNLYIRMDDLRFA